MKKRTEIRSISSSKRFIQNAKTCRENFQKLNLSYQITFDKLKTKKTKLLKSNNT